MKDDNYIPGQIKDHFGPPFERNLIITLAIVWFLLIAGSFLWHVRDIKRDIQKLAEREAISRVNKDTCYRYWIAQMGGIYVKASEAPPDRFLIARKDAELLTTSGERLVLIDPAYMTKMAFELNKELYGIMGHISSLSPEKPDYRPDSWERAALEGFERGQMQKVSMVTIDGEKYIRAMKALVIGPTCMKCHESQGYQVGDIKGGISISLPFASYESIIEQQVKTFSFIHGLILILGLLTLFVGADISRRNKAKWLKDIKKRHILMEALPDLVCFKDEDGRWLAANRSMLKLFGLEGVDFIKKKGADLAKYAPFFRQVFHNCDETDQMAWQSGKAIRQEVTIPLSNGQSRTFDMMKVPVFDKDREREGLVVVGRDITEDKKNQEALERISKLKDLVLDLATGFINIPEDSLDEHINRTLGMAGSFLSMDRAYLFEYDHEARVMSNTHEWCAKGIGPHINDLQNISMDNYPDWMDTHMRGEVIQIPSVDDLPDGRLRKALKMQSIKSLITVPLMYEGVCLGFVGFDSVRSKTTWSDDHVSLIRMISEIYANVLKRKEMLRLLQASEKRYRDLVEGLPVGLYQRTPGPDGKFIMANQALAKMLDYEKSEELVGQDVARFCFNLQNQRCCERELKESGVVRDRQVQLMRRNGEIFWASISARAILDKQGEIVSVEGSVLDITDRKKGKEEKQRLHAQLQQAQRIESIGRLAGGIAHDFNNILVPILGYSELLFNITAPDDKIRDYIEPIIEAGERARDIVRQLLAFSRKQVIEKNPIDLNDEIIGFEKFLRRTLREDIEIVLELEPNIPVIEADSSQIDQVILNLAVNAQDAMPNGGRITIKTALLELDDKFQAGMEPIGPGSYVMMSLSDNGEGMDEQILKQIFEPFFTTKSKDKGTGLGLATVYGIVRQHGGHIRVSSEVGLGTTFDVYLPVSERRYFSGPVVEQSTDIPGGDETILLIEDDEKVRDFVFRMLKQSGYNVIQVSTPGEALEKYKNSSLRIDLLLTDVIMPEMNGKELYRHLKEYLPDLEVLYMSGYAPDVISLAMDRNFISKPFSIRQLAKAVRRVLDN